MNNTHRISAFIVSIALTGILYAQSAASYYQKGYDLQMQEQYFSAVEQYQAAVTKNKSYADAWIGLAECSYALGEYRLCLGYLDNADKYVKNRSDIRNLRGFALIGLGYTADARQVFEQVLKQWPNNLDSRFGLAELEILEGRVAGAEKQYSEALLREDTNRRALVSLALVSNALGKTAAARSYITQAISFHSQEPEVYYFGARLALQDGDLSLAESYIRRAISLDSSYDDAYLVLENLLYNSGRYEESLAVCDIRLSRNRNLANAWYVRGLCQSALGDVQGALTSYKTGLSIDPHDEILRMAMELLILEQLPVEDPERIAAAAYHADKAVEYIKKYYSVQARYEYQRSLRLNPLDCNVRLAYADLLLSDGYTETYVAELQFVQSQGKSTQTIDDIVEGYTSILSSTLPASWNVNTLLLDKNRWTMGVYYLNSWDEPIHPDAVNITVRGLCDIFSTSSKADAQPVCQPVSSFTEAFSAARAAGYNYFCILDFAETERETAITLDMYSTRTGNKAGSWNVYRTGNDRYASSLRRLRECVVSALPYYSVLTDRKGSVGLIDAGAFDGAQTGSVWAVLPAAALFTSDAGLGVSFEESQILGTFTVTKVGEEIAEGTLSQKGFYDRMAVGDVLVQLSENDLAENGTEGTTGSSGTNAYGVTVIADDPAVLKTATSSQLLQLLRTVR